LPVDPAVLRIPRLSPRHRPEGSSGALGHTRRASNSGLAPSLSRNFRHPIGLETDRPAASAQPRRRAHTTGGARTDMIKGLWTAAASAAGEADRTSTRPEVRY